MPANLNALLRYKTIDICLSNPYRKWTIADLTEACSANLKESRGIESGVSERTIREDIHVMRSDILGFNAPIVQQDGHYSYEDPSYSIFNVNIHETELLKRVLDFVLELRDEIDHPKIGEIILTISKALTERDTPHIRPDILKSKKAGLLEEPDSYPGSDIEHASDLEYASDFAHTSGVEDEIINEDTKIVFEGHPPIPDLPWSGILNLLG